MQDQVIETIDAEMGALQKQIQELERRRTMHGKKMKAVGKVREQLAKLLADEGLQEAELFTIISDRIVVWLKASAPAAGQSAPSYWIELQEYFGAQGKSVKRAPATKRSRAVPEGMPAPLRAGLYRNPHTGASVQKIRRPPAMLASWCEQYGLEEVRSWLVDDSQ